MLVVNFLIWLFVIYYLLSIEYYQLLIRLIAQSFNCYFQLPSSYFSLPFVHFTLYSLQTLDKFHHPYSEENSAKSDHETTERIQGE